MATKTSKYGLIKIDMTDPAYIVASNPNFDTIDAALAAYGICVTNAATAAKTVTITDYKLVPGSRVAIKMTGGNTAASPTLNINNTGAKPIYLNGAAPATTWIRSGMVLELVYNGSQYEIVNGVGIATSTNLGSVKSGNDIAVGSDGTMTLQAPYKYIYYQALTDIGPFTESTNMLDIFNAMATPSRLACNISNGNTSVYPASSGTLAINKTSSDTGDAMFMDTYGRVSTAVFTPNSGGGYLANGII